MGLTRQNSIPSLCELEVRFHADDSNGSISCSVDLRVDKGEIPLGDDECSVSFRKLIISVNTEGLELSPGSRFGEPLKENVVPRQVATTINRGKKVKAGFGFDLSRKGGDFSANGGASGSAEYNQQETYTEDADHIRVTARPNKNWEVTELGASALSGTYMDDDILFRASPNRASNRRAATITIKVKQRDLSINEIFRNESMRSFFSSLTENQRRLIDIFIAKSLSNAAHGKRRYVGEISLSEVEYIHED